MDYNIYYNMEIIDVKANDSDSNILRKNIN